MAEMRGERISCALLVGYVLCMLGSREVPQRSKAPQQPLCCAEDTTPLMAAIVPFTGAKTGCTVK